jgi:hypothetical protein
MDDVGARANSQTPTTPVVSIDQYKELVDRCARERLDYIISNGLPSHARVLIAKLFETARQSVSIVSRHLTDVTGANEDIYGDPNVIAQAVQFLRREGTRLEIILDEAVHFGTKNRFLHTVIGDEGRKGDVVLYPDTGIIKNNKTPHFMVTDALAYRFEIDDKRVTALANFGDKRTATLLQALFHDTREYVCALDKKDLRFGPKTQFEIT